MVGIGSLADAGCRKAGCQTGSDTLHRHHRRHQAMWLSIWARRIEPGNEYEAFVKRYWRFESDDIEYICDWHHAEIHIVYDSIIQKHKAELGKPLWKYTWNEAHDLMDQLEKAFWLWLREATPGVDPRERFFRGERVGLSIKARDKKGRKKRRRHRKRRDA